MMYISSLLIIITEEQYYSRLCCKNITPSYLKELRTKHNINYTQTVNNIEKPPMHHL